MQDQPERKVARRDPESSRQALIDATLDTIAEIGLTETTITNIIRRAGLSRGMVHLHFGGKDNLLTEATRSFSDEYHARMERLTDIGEASPEARIMAIVAADLSAVLLNPRSTRIWHAFRGAAGSHSGIAKYSSTQDEKLVRTMREAFRQIAEGQGGEAISAEEATYGTLAMLEGFWVHYLTDMERFSRAEAFHLVRRMLAGLFPGRFAPDAPYAARLEAIIAQRS